jgi:hypothetical protein
MGGRKHGVDEIMDAFLYFVQRYLSPFLAGVCAAGATVVTGIAAAVVLLVAAAFLGFASLPAGERVIKRIAGAAA